MNELPGQPAREKKGRSIERLALGLMLAAGGLFVTMTWLYAFYDPNRIGVAQPISFSHRLHANEKGIGCLVCHPDALQGRRAGIPPLETCMLCHERIIVTHPEIQKVRAAYARSEPIEWKQVYNVPEFVYFDHETHLRRGVDCGDCHGDVREMDRLAEAHEFTMGFCVQCHRDNKASHDCWMCHR